MHPPPNYLAPPKPTHPPPLYNDLVRNDKMPYTEINSHSHKIGILVRKR